MARLIFRQGGSSKFWEANVRGSELHVTWGKIGTAGQSQAKKFATPAAANAEAQALTLQKHKKGYVEEKAGKPVATAPAADIVVRDSIGTIGAAWQLGSSVWFAKVEADELKGKSSFAEAIAVENRVERWRFANDAQARTAIAYVKKHAATPHAVKVDTSANEAAWAKQLGKEQPRVARLGPGSAGAIVTRDQTHPWLHARVPATSFVSGRLMVPVWSLVGAIDARFGKRTGVYVSTCPQQTLQPYIEGVWEVVVQRPEGSEVDAYFTGHDGQFATVHLSQQFGAVDARARWAVVEHSGDKSTVGWYRTHHVKQLAEAKKLFAEKVARHAGFSRVKALGPWYSKILDDITHHNRVPTQKPVKVAVGEHHAAMMQSVSDIFGQPSRTVLGADVVSLGGAPEFCQENWDFQPANPWSKAPLLCLASFGVRDEPLWSDVANDGDAGTFNIWAAIDAPFGVTTFSCH